MIIYQVRRLTKKWIFFFYCNNVMKDINIMCALSFNSVEGKIKKSLKQFKFNICMLFLSFLKLTISSKFPDPKAKNSCTREKRNKFYCPFVLRKLQIFLFFIIWKMLKAFYFSYFFAIFFLLNVMFLKQMTRIWFISSHTNNSLYFVVLIVGFFYYFDIQLLIAAFY